jgi:hypothetical protein
MKWPTLEGRLNQPLTSTEEAIKQMEANGDILTEYAKRIFKKTKKHCLERRNRKR